MKFRLCHIGPALASRSAERRSSTLCRLPRLTPSPAGVSKELRRASRGKPRQAERIERYKTSRLPSKLPAADSQHYLCTSCRIVNLIYIPGGILSSRQKEVGSRGGKGGMGACLPTSARCKSSLKSSRGAGMREAAGEGGGGGQLRNTLSTQSQSSPWPRPLPHPSPVGRHRGGGLRRRP